jgi:uncharacterized membrane protein (UPF0136 family)
MTDRYGREHDQGGFFSSIVMNIADYLTDRSQYGTLNIAVGLTAALAGYRDNLMERASCAIFVPIK